MTGVQTCALPICFPVTISVQYGSVATLPTAYRSDLTPSHVVAVGSDNPRLFNPASGSSVQTENSSTSARFAQKTRNLG